MTEIFSLLAGFQLRLLKLPVILRAAAVIILKIKLYYFLVTLFFIYLSEELIFRTEVTLN